VASLSASALSDSPMDFDDFDQLRQLELDQFVAELSDGTASPFTWRSAISDDDLGPSGAAAARTRWKRAWALIKAANRCAVDGVLTGIHVSGAENSSRIPASRCVESTLRSSHRCVIAVKQVSKSDVVVGRGYVDRGRSSGERVGEGVGEGGIASVGTRQSSRARG
jgi:hypothetical protein